MFGIWELIKKYYFALAREFHVDPIIYVGIHVVATPLFILAIAWLVRNYRKKKKITFPTIVTILIFNASNFYLVFFGKHIPWYIFTIIAVTTILSGYFSYHRTRKKMQIDS